MNFLIDTCVLSEFVKPHPADVVLGWLRGQNKASLFMSAITLGELTNGIVRLPDGERKNHLLSWLNKDLKRHFLGRCLPITPEIAETWGILCAECSRRGKPLPVVDSLLAATALAHGLTIVTRNLKDFATAGILVHNPWN